ncbi:MAG: S8 family serine peptidase [Verrucomicrobiota bacterium]
MRKSLAPIGALILVFCLFGLTANAANEPLVWHADKKTFDAEISGVELQPLLQKIATVTGWEVYLEPGTSYSGSAKFKSLPQSEALRLLLGKLSFEISPTTNSVSRLLVFRTGAGKATQLIRTEKNIVVLGKDKVIKNHLIVTLKPGSSMNIAALAQQLGGKIIGKLDGTDSYLLEFPDELAANAAREQLSKVDSVASIDSNYSLEKPAPFAMASVDGSSPFNLKSDAGPGDGKQIVIGLIDTAVQRLNDNMQGFMLAGLSVAGEANVNSDLPMHGTTMAESMLLGLNSTLSGQTASIKILSVDIYGPNPSTTTFNVAQGITAAVNGGANILSLSLGSEGDSEFLRNLIQQVSQKNIPIFAAAGNQPVTTPTYPAAYPEVIAVTSAGDRTDTIASYANRGSFVDVILPGATVISYGGSSYYVNGTSVSTALASGMMAGLAYNSKRPPGQVESTFRSAVAYKR